MNIKAVIFDLDGTIAAFNLDYKAVRAEVRSYLIKKGVPESLITVNKNVFDMLKDTELFMTNAGKKAELIDEIRKIVLQITEKYELEAARETSLIPGVIDTLKELRRRNIKIGLCTINSSKSTENILRRFKISEYFDAISSRDQVAKFKPDPEHCNACLEELNVTSAETMVVGDSITDIQAAKEIKAISVGLPTGVSTQEQLISHGVNYVITSIIDLPILIERINSP